MSVLINCFLFLLCSSLWAQSDFFERADTFFGKYVSNGIVNYDELKENPSELNRLVEEIANMKIPASEPTQLKAFYINAYNILVVKQVVDRYPIEGPLKVEGFFNGIKHRVMGLDLTLDQLEKGTLYTQFPDPKLHFVLVCAAKGCPPLASFSYKPTQLNQQISAQVRQVLNLDWFIRVDKSTAISQIFSWYEKDFLVDNTSVIAFINTYRTKKINDKLPVTYYEYDWSLNE